MNRIALDLGFIQIYWYSVFIIIAMFVGCLVIYREIKKQNINEEFVINLLFYGLIFGLIGARLYFVAFNLDYYLKYPLEILEIWNGGLAIHGGIIAGFIWMVFYTKKYKTNTMKILDITVPGLLIGQAIGRWGNFFNQEAFGGITSKLALEKLGLPNYIIEGMKIDGVYRQPTFLYESVWNFIGFIAILMLRKYKYIKTGQLTGFYLMWYSFGRFFIEGMRTDSLMLGPIRIAQLVSVLLFIVGLLLFIFAKKGGSRFDNLYKEASSDEIRF
ncbi:MAG: prolipoprotein diacylglyceryl transferase [Bacilli bacterium]